MDKIELITILRERKGIITASSILDNLTHDAATHEASVVNNNGIEAQLDFLGRMGWSNDDILKAMEE